MGPRDGLQNERRALRVDERVTLVERCASAGLRRIEAVSFVSARRVPQMAEPEAVMAELPRPPGVRYSGLVLSERGARRAIDAGVDEMTVVVLATDEFSRRNQGVPVAEMLAATERIAECARDAAVPLTVMISAAFGCPFEGEVNPGRVGELVRAAAALEPAELALADTIGVAVPAQVRRLIELAVAEAPGIPLRLHLHNTRNTGYANAWAAVEAGVTALDASVGGIGGCPFAPRATGNIATEDLAYLLDRSGVATGIDGAAAAATGTWIAELLGIDAPALLGRAGPFPPVGEAARSGDRIGVTGAPGGVS